VCKALGWVVVGVKPIRAFLCLWSQRPSLLWFSPAGEAMYYPLTRLSYDDGDTTPFTVLDPSGESLGFVSFTKELKCLPRFLRAPLAHLRC